MPPFSCRPGGNSAAGRRIARLKVSSLDILERSIVTEIRKAGKNFYTCQFREHAPLRPVPAIRNSLDLI